MERTFVAGADDQNEPDKALSGSAEFMIEVAIKSFMLVHNVDLETAKRCILNTAVAMLDKEEAMKN